MIFRPLRTIQLDPESPGFRADLERRFKGAEDQLGLVTAVPILESVILADEELVDNVTRNLLHGLGRPWRGWVVTNLEGATTTGRVVHITGEDKSRYLRLRANGWGATITVSLLVF